MLSRQLRGQAGFTLLEILITLAIMGAVFAMIGSILVAVLDTHHRVERAVLPNKLGPSILALMTRDLQGVYAYDLEEAFVGRDDGVGEAQQDSLDFVTTRSGAPDEEGRRSLFTEVGYVLQEREGRAGFFTLFRRESSGMDETPLSGGGYTPVYSNVVSLDLKYLPHGDEEDWLDQWEAGPSAPAAVWIHLVVAPEYETGEGADPDEGAPEPRSYTTVVNIPITPVQPLEGEDEAEGEDEPEGGGSSDGDSSSGDGSGDGSGG